MYPRLLLRQIFLLPSCFNTSYIPIFKLLTYYCKYTCFRNTEIHPMMVLILSGGLTVVIINH
ncbi:hypothetical protein BDV40DRAFT_257800 [Aspergillus tamarii]|uniref:Uncharacterized protein n=1 Tax=Aspergillus tamarii TaxID=41984 RepID=A0A5N6V3K0_ASPTM|nr:hypothetical protein BDV40DRAFT_257800 [Aspergillus tamarii]